MKSYIERAWWIAKWFCEYENMHGIILAFSCTNFQRNGASMGDFPLAL